MAGSALSWMDGRPRIWMLMILLLLLLLPLLVRRTLTYTSIGFFGTSNDSHKEIYHKPPSVPEAVYCRRHSPVATAHLKDRAIRKARRDLQG